VKVDIFLDLKQAEEGKSEAQAIEEAMLSLLQTSWEDDLAPPTLYYDPRTVLGGTSRVFMQNVL
jgi:hypothetical protein